jgi:hypothetical protein
MCQFFGSLLLVFHLVTTPMSNHGDNRERIMIYL